MMTHHFIIFLLLVTFTASMLSTKKVEIPDSFKTSGTLTVEHEVYITDDAVPFATAEAWCRGIGGYIPIPKQKEEWNMFYRTIDNVENSESGVWVWTDATDSVTEGVFLDKDGNDVTKDIDWFTADEENGKRQDADYVFCGVLAIMEGCQEVKPDDSDTKAGVRGLCYVPAPINDCASSPCKNGAVCKDDVYAFKCSCATGFTGPTCNRNIDDCKPGTCVHGTCQDLVNDFSCTCNDGWEGKKCDKTTFVDHCASSPCENGGQCTNDGNTFRCTCAAGYTGTSCQTNIDDCDSSPCNHGSCQDRVNGYSCTCDAGWQGATCNRVVDHCASSPCNNGGQCTNAGNTFSCYCAAGWKGERCGNNIDDCLPRPCAYGTCQDLVNGFSCICDAGWEGVNCLQRKQVRPQPQPQPGLIFGHHGGPGRFPGGHHGGPGRFPGGHHGGPDRRPGGHHGGPDRRPGGPGFGGPGGHGGHRRPSVHLGRGGFLFG